MVVAREDNVLLNKEATSVLEDKASDDIEGVPNRLEFNYVGKL